MKKLLQCRHLIALLLAACFLLSSCGSGASATSMRLIRSEGTIAVADGEGESITPVENLSLYGGYRVSTGDASYAWINLDNVKLTKMDQETEIAITKEDKHLEIEVQFGALFFNVTEPLAEDESMNIRTSNIAAGIRGTCGWVEIPDRDHMNLYLLEGKVECIAGDKTVSVSAGETAAMSADGEITVTPFTATDVPSFVIKEIKDDEDLIKAILEDSGIDILANPLISYADALSEIKGELLYTDVLDFEADGSPELLVLYLPNDPESSGKTQIYAKIFRDGPDGPSELSSFGWNCDTFDTTTISLAESDGRLYLHSCSTDSIYEEDGSASYMSGAETYNGSIAQRDGLRTDWGRIEWLQYHRTTSTDPFQHGYPSFEGAIGNTNERGFADGFNWGYTAEEYESVREKYSEVRVLVYCPDGENLIITPDPSEVNQSSAELIAPYAGVYTDDYHTSISFILDENGVFSATGTEYYGGYCPIASLGVTPESVTQRVDGTIWVTINENETYAICPPGVLMSTIDGFGYYFDDRTRVNIIYINSADTLTPWPLHN